MPEPTTFPRAKPLLPLFHGSASAPHETTKLLGGKCPYTIEGNNLVRDKDSLIPLVFTTHDPLLALAYALRQRTTFPSIVTEHSDKDGLYTQVCMVIFQTFDENGKDTTFDEYLKPLTIFTVDDEGRDTYYDEDNNKNTGTRLGSRWIIHGEAESKAIAMMNSIHDVAATGVDIYIADGKLIDMVRKPVAPSFETRFHNYRYSFDFEKHDQLRSAFDQPETRAKLLESGTIKYINTALAGPSPAHSPVTNLVKLRSVLEDTLDSLALKAQALAEAQNQTPKI